MTDLNKLRSEFEKIEQIKSILHSFEWLEESNKYQIKESVINGDVFDLILAKDNEQFLNGAWFGWQEKAKAQAVPDNTIVVPKTKEVVVAIEKMVEQQVEASGITSDVFRLDGWRILDAIQEASESGAEG